MRRPISVDYGCGRVSSLRLAWSALLDRSVGSASAHGHIGGRRVISRTI
jgi:hypothetical protein